MQCFDYYVTPSKTMSENPTRYFKEGMSQHNVEQK